MKKILVLLAAIFILAGCSNTEKTSDKKVVYTSFYPIYSLTKTIANDKVEVRSFMPSNKDAHHWEPSAKDLKDLSKSGCLIVNGAGMESWQENVTKNLKDLKVVDLSKNISLIKTGESAPEGDYKLAFEIELKKGENKIIFGHTHAKSLHLGFAKPQDTDLKKLGLEIMHKKAVEVKQKDTFKPEDGQKYEIEMAHNSGEVTINSDTDKKWIVFADRNNSESLPYSFKYQGQEIATKVLDEKQQKVSYDPHSFLSLVNARQYAKDITSALIEISPENEEEFKKNRDELIKEIDSLDNEYKDKFKNLKKRSFVVMHEAFGYLARDYKLTQLPLNGLISTEDTDIKAVQDAIKHIKEDNIGTVFYEKGHSDATAQNIAKEADIKISELDTMEYGDADSKYLDVFKKNLQNIYESLAN